TDRAAVRAAVRVRCPCRSVSLPLLLRLPPPARQRLVLRAEPPLAGFGLDGHLVVVFLAGEVVGAISGLAVDVPLDDAAGRRDGAAGGASAGATRSARLAPALSEAAGSGEGGFARARRSRPACGSRTGVVGWGLAAIGLPLIAVDLALRAREVG